MVYNKKFEEIKKTILDIYESNSYNIEHHTSERVREGFIGVVDKDNNVHSFNFVIDNKTYDADCFYSCIGENNELKETQSFIACASDCLSLYNKIDRLIADL